jgi:peptidoglycan-N-acetylglucosamine deacetylase
MAPNTYSREALNELRRILLSPEYLADAVEPLIAQILSERIAQEPDEMVDALAPAVRPTVEATLSEALRENSPGVDEGLSKALHRTLAEALGRWADEHPEELAKALQRGIGKDVDDTAAPAPLVEDSGAMEVPSKPADTSQAPERGQRKPTGLFGRGRLLLAGLALLSSLNLALLGLQGWGSWTSASAMVVDELAPFAIGPTATPNPMSLAKAVGGGLEHSEGSAPGSRAVRARSVARPSQGVSAITVEARGHAAAERATAMPATDQVTSLPQEGAASEAQAMGAASSGQLAVPPDEGAPTGKVVYLTFDDGPNPRWTPRILELLAEYDAKATFFVLGQEAAGRPDLVQQILDAGHVVGHHTWSHRLLVGLEREEIMEEIWRTDEALKGAASPCLRPPYGTIDEASRAVVEELGYEVVLWSIDPRDWTGEGAEAIAANVISNAAPGCTVVLHDGGGDRSETVAALEIVLETLSTMGYRFESVCVE